jgi:hypothetical protein
MEQTNVIVFPTEPPESDRLRLYRDEPCTILILPAARIVLDRSHQPRRASAARLDACPRCEQRQFCLSTPAIENVSERATLV